MFAHRHSLLFRLDYIYLYIYSVLFLYIVSFLFLAGNNLGMKVQLREKGNIARIVCFV